MVVHAASVIEGLAMVLPTREEISPYDDLDGRVACDHFLGRTIEEGEALFRQNSLYYQDDLMWMGPVAFQFYVESAIRYLQSQAAEGDSGFASALAATIDFRLQHDRDSLSPILNRLVFVCQYLVTNWSRFDDETGVYGDVRSRLSAIQATLSEMNAS